MITKLQVRFCEAFFIIPMFLVITSCAEIKKGSAPTSISNTEEMKIDRASELRQQLFDSNNDSIMVIAHRGDWRNAPENSILAIKSAIEMGVDIVEIDIQKTKDGKLVLMHDKTIDRTTNGEGQVADFTLDSLKTFVLKNGMGRPTYQRIPTLQEAMETSKDKILVNLDKSYSLFDQVYSVLRETNTVNQVIVKGKVPYAQVKKEFGQYLNDVIFMPIISLDHPESRKIAEDYISKFQPAAIEFVFKNEDSSLANEFKSIRKRGSRVWVNSLWASLNAGYEDEIAVQHTDSIYGWYIKKGINMIQTDRPQLLLDFLRKNGLHK